MADPESQLTANENRLVEAFSDILQDSKKYEGLSLVTVLREKTGLSRPEVRRFLKTIRKGEKKGLL